MNRNTLKIWVAIKNEPDMCLCLNVIDLINLLYMYPTSCIVKYSNSMYFMSKLLVNGYLTNLNVANIS